MHAHSIFRHALAACASMLVLAGAPAAFAGDGGLRLEFRCAQGGDDSYNVLCVPVAGPSERGAADADRAAQPPAVTRVAPRRNHLRPVAMRTHEEIFSADGWYVPLYGPPTDMERVRELLHAVLCGRHADCAVHYYGNETVADGQEPRR